MVSVFVCLQVFCRRPLNRTVIRLKNPWLSTHSSVGTTPRSTRRSSFFLPSLLSRSRLPQCTARWLSRFAFCLRLALGFSTPELVGVAPLVLLSMNSQFVGTKPGFKHSLAPSTFRRYRGWNDCTSMVTVLHSFSTTTTKYKSKNVSLVMATLC
ncbi:hypothetical protein CA13_09730 [Planctomycetes bacterium CA13]|uniref:Uncharacterized protein n=1 Tax=Novipirellula herctigrandis TaxID=2527986 RepID=A0A5C5YWZ9_9BACT|nr:hypothetical protein CA13_09730 [Planctomycetes bacterium CA13]